MNQKVALTLSGGGARGLAHIGVIEELIKNNYEITSIGGTSMGALIGGIYALGKLKEFKEWAFSLSNIQIYSLIDFSFSNHGLIKGDKIFNAMDDFLQDINIEELSIPYFAVATDIKHKKEILLNKGSLIKAIRSSIAIPTVFTPVEDEDRLLVDGGLMNNLPINHITRTKNDILIAVDVNADIPVIAIKPEEKEEYLIKENVYTQKLQEFQEYLHNLLPHKEKEEKLGYFELVNETIALMVNRIAQLSNQNIYPDLLIEISKETCSTLDFFRAKYLVETGRLTAQKCLSELKTK